MQNIKATCRFCGNIQNAEYKHCQKCQKEIYESDSKKTNNDLGKNDKFLKKPWNKFAAPAFIISLICFMILSYMPQFAGDLVFSRIIGIIIVATGILCSVLLYKHNYKLIPTFFIVSMFLSILFAGTGTSTNQAVIALIPFSLFFTIAFIVLGIWQTLILLKKKM